MKLTETAIELMAELRSIECPHNAHYLNGDGGNLKDNLLALFIETNNPETHEIIINIMNEVGSPLFEHNEEDIDESITASPKSISMHKREGQIMSDVDLLDLLPANGYIH